MSADVDLRSLGGKVKKATFALVSRTVALELATLGGTIALTRLLDPRDFGVFAIVQFALGIMVFFGDTGVGGALVRQLDEPTETQLSSLFQLQIGVAVGFFALLLAGAGLLPRIWPDLPAGAPLLLRVMALNLVLVTVRVVPSLLLERRMEFGKLAAFEVLGSLSFYGLAVGLAALGLGVWALAAGVLAQGAIMTVGMFRLCPWRPRARFEWAALRPLLRFGLAQQSRGVVGLVNDAVTPLWGGRVLGTQAVGFVNWGQSTAYFPLKLVEILSRIGFPVFARMQGDRRLLAESLGRMVQLCACVTLGWAGLCLGLGRELTAFVFSDKWLPAVPILAIFAGAIAIGFLSPLVAVALDAIGKPGVFARLAVGWTALNWLVVPLATRYGHTTGFAAGFAVHVVVGNIAVLIVLARVLPEARLWPRIRGPLCAAAAMAALGRFVLSARATSLWTFIGCAGIALFCYLAIVWFLDGRAIVQALSVVPGAIEPGAIEPGAIEPKEAE